MSDDRRRRMCTGKTRYRDDVAAAAAIEALEWDQDREERGRLRAYRCEYCDRWHLTSQPPRS